MNNGTRIVKRLLALFLVVLMSINSLGAVVSDNDGSAFITKAEFDSLKNDFQSQIDQYNTSIDAKIDGAIASYLAGIKVEKTSVLPWLIGGKCMITDADKINDLEWGYADLDIVHFQLHPNLLLTRGNNWSTISFKRAVDDNNWEIFSIDNTKKKFKHYAYDAGVNLKRASTYVRNGSWFAVAEADLPPNNSKVRLRWHAGASNTEPHVGLPVHQQLPFEVGKAWNGSPGVWSERLNDENWILFYATAFIPDGESQKKDVNIGIYALETAGNHSVNVTIDEAPDKVVNLIFENGISESRIWTLPFDTDDGKNQVWAADCSNYIDYIGDNARKKSVTNPGKADSLEVSFMGRMVGRSDIGIWRDFSGVIWVETGDYNHDTSDFRTALDWCEFLFYNQQLKGQNLINENIEAAILTDYASYGYRGELQQGFPIGVFADGNIIEFDLDATPIENDTYIAFSTTPFSNGSTSKVYLENVANDASIELAIDGMQQSKSVARITPSVHKIKLRLSTEKRVPVFWKMAYPSTMTKSPRKSFTLPKEYFLTSS